MREYMTLTSVISTRSAITTHTNVITSVILTLMIVITTCTSLISTRRVEFPHAECNFNTHECDFYTQCDYDTHECDYKCDFNTNDCDYDMQKINFYTQSTIFTRSL
jgi:hypothetical protein